MANEPVLMRDEIPDDETRATPMPDEDAAGEGEAPATTVKSMAEAFKRNMAQVEGTQKPESAPKQAKEEQTAKPSKSPSEKLQDRLEGKKADARPEAKPPATKAASEQQEDKPPPAIKGKAAEEWRNYRMEMTSLLQAKDAELKKLQQELSQNRGKEDKTRMDPDEFARLKKENQELSGLLERTALEQSPAFQNRYGKRAETIMSNAANSVANEHKDAVVTLLSMPATELRRKQLSALMKDMEQPEAVALSVAISEMDRLRTDRDTELSNYRDTLRRQEEEAALEEQQKTEGRKAHQKKLLKYVLQLAPEDFSAFRRSGNSEEDALVDEYEKDVEKALLGDLTESEAAFLPVLAAEGAHLKQIVVPKLEAKIKELEGQLSELGESNPNPQPTGEGRKISGRSGRTPFIDAFNKAAKE